MDPQQPSDAEPQEPAQASDAEPQEPAQEVQPDPGRKPRFRGPMLALPAVAAAVLVLIFAATLRSRSTDETPPPAPSPLPSAFVATNSFLECTNCHGDLDLVFKQGRLPKLTFTHEKHFAIGVSDCAACHVANTHEQDKINKPTMTTCYMCHGLGGGYPAPGRCTTCHPAGMNPEPVSHRVPNWVPPEHARAARTKEFDCSTCHQRDFCVSCHGLQLPHPQGWEETPHAVAFYDEPALCENCHPRAPFESRDFCDTCHHPQGPDSVTWVAFHPDVVKTKGATTCFECHASDTCATCHRKGEVDLSADRAQFEQEQAAAGSSGSTG